MTFSEWWKSLPEYHALKARDREIPSTRGFVQEAWDAAVEAERERCAEIAENWQDMPSVQDDVTGCMAAYSEGQECTAPDGIAAAIRGTGG